MRHVGEEITFGGICVAGILKSVAQCLSIGKFLSLIE